MLNQTILIGNLGNNPDLFYSQEGDPIANFNLAFSCSRKKTGWIRVVAFKKLAEIVEQYLHKGAKIAVVGVLDQQKWENDNGEKRSSFQLLANTIEFIKTNKTNENPSQESKSQEPDDDDLPF